MTSRKNGDGAGGVSRPRRRPPRVRAQSQSPYRVVIAISLGLVPLLGVLVLGWSVFGVVLYYWMESVVAAAMLVPREVVAERSQRAGRGRAARESDELGLAGDIVAAFIVVFVFALLPMLALGLLVVAIFGRGATPGAVDATVGTTGVLAGLAAIVAAQVVDFCRDLGRGTRALRDSVDAQTARVFDSHVVIILTVIVAGYFIERLGGPVAGLCVLIALKTTVDLLQPER